MKRTGRVRKIFALSVALVMVLSCSLLSYANVESGSSDVMLKNDLQLLQEIKSKIDIDYGYNIAKTGSQMGSGELGFRTSGSTGEHAVAHYLEKSMNDLGLSNVTKYGSSVDAWNFEGASLEVTDSNGTKKTMILSSYAGSAGTSSQGISGEIVYVGGGTLSDYEGIDVTGKIVLAEFDMYMDYWASQPSYQAELKGAKALIVGYTGSSYGTTGDALNSFDAIARTTLPIMNISRDDAAALKAILADGVVTGKLISKATIDYDGISYNVVGEIPGKMTDKYIVLGAHYDGYFNAFQDDIVGVGVFMSVAKAILDSGYQPNYTIKFVAFGSEEYGLTDSHYDWIRGSYCQVYEHTPEWSENTIMFLNFDTQRPDMKQFVINVTPEYNQFFKKYILTLDLPEPWVDGAVIKGTNGPWSDDYNFISQGIPSLITGKGNTDWKYKYYHTNYDDYTIYNPVTFRFNVENYLAMTLTFDQLIVPPLNFAKLMEDSDASLGSDLIAAVGLSDSELREASASLQTLTTANYVNIQKANNILNRLRAAETIGAVTADVVADYEARLMVKSEAGLEIYKLLEKDFTKLDAWDVVMYGHEITQIDTQALLDAKSSLSAGEPEAALKAIRSVQSAWMIPLFEKEVYDYWGVEATNPENELYWGNGKTYPVIDLFDVYHAIADKTKSGNTNFTEELVVLDVKLKEAISSLNEALKSETAIVKAAAAMASDFNLVAEVKQGETILASAYGNIIDNYTYGDLDSNFWAYDTIMGLMLEGVLESGGNFKADSAASRMEIAKWITLAFNLPIDADVPEFTDVNASSDDMKYVAAVVKAGIMQGYGDGKFMPYASLTRAQMATIAVKLLDLEEASSTSKLFSDVSMNKWYSQYVQSASEVGLFVGYPNGTFGPEKQITKAEASIIVEKLAVMK